MALNSRFVFILVYYISFQKVVVFFRYHYKIWSWLMGYPHRKNNPCWKESFLRFKFGKMEKKCFILSKTVAEVLIVINF